MKPEVSAFDQLFFVAHAWEKPIVRSIWPKVALACQLESDKKLFDWCWFEANGDIPCSRDLSSELATLRSYRDWFIWDYNNKAPRYSGIGGSGDWVYELTIEGKKRAEKSTERLYERFGESLPNQMIGLIKALKQIEEENFDALEWIGRSFFALYVFREQKGRQYINAILQDEQIEQVKQLVLDRLNPDIAPRIYSAAKKSFFR